MQVLEPHSSDPAIDVRDATQASAIGLALRLLGDRWTLLILREAFLNRSRRFHQWRDALGVSDSVLAGRLRDLVRDEVLVAVGYGQAPSRREYRLTERGLELWRILVAIWAWEARWVEHRAQPLPSLLHLDCGAEVAPVLGCAACGEPVGARDTEAAAPSSALGLAAPPRFRRRSSKQQEPTDPQLMFPETIAILGDRWSAVVLAAAFLGTRRFVDFERAVGISPTLLSRRLRTLVAVGVLRRTPASGRGGGVEYRLSEKGLAFFAVVALLVDWAQRWFTGPDGSLLRIVHRRCGQPLVPVLACDRCGGALERRRVRFVPDSR